MTKHKITTEEIIKGPFSRSAEIGEISIENRTVELSFSSQTAEVFRWFGVEILDHSEGAIRLNRINTGGALLINHNPDDQVGVVEKAWVDGDKCRALVRFGSGERAQEIFTDVRDKIRQLVSVNYTPYAIKMIETRSDGTDVYLVTDWEPNEISIVSIPADISVGVGRSASETPPVSVEIKQEISSQANNEEESPMPTTATERTAETVTATTSQTEKISVINDERERVKSMLELGRQYKEGDLAASFVSDGKSIDELQRALLDKFNEKSNRPTKDLHVGLDDNEIRQYSFIKAVRSLVKPNDKKLRDEAAFEFECSAAAEKAYGRSARGLMIPHDVLSRAINSSTDGQSAGNTGGYLIGTTHMAGSFIEILRKKMVIMKLATPMGGLVGNVDIPKQTSAAAAYWVGEGDPVTASGGEFGHVELKPKTVGARASVTRRMMIQSSPDIETLVRTDIATAIALGVDRASFYGSGSDNQPLGIANTDGINATIFDSTYPTFEEIVDMESKIAADDADVDGMYYIFNATMRGNLKTTKKFPDAPGDGTIWEQGKTVNGYATSVTNQINDGDVFFGNFADVLLAMWGGIDILPDPYSDSAKGGLWLTAFQDVDVALRRPVSFNLGRAD